MGHRGIILGLAVAVLSPAMLPWYVSWGMALYAAAAWTRPKLVFAAFVSLFLVIVYYPSGEDALYNFPYLFGYLFSMGVYLRRANGGADFYPRYVALLRDTGRMTAEQLARQHLDTALEGPTFWRSTIDRLEPRVAAFEEVVATIA